MQYLQFFTTLQIRLIYVVHRKKSIYAVSFSHYLLLVLLTVLVIIAFGILKTTGCCSTIDEYHVPIFSFLACCDHSDSDDDHDYLA
jgi:hypothetical protein